MRGYCRKCGGSFSGQMLCPQCGVQLGNGSSGSISLPSEACTAGPDGPAFFRRLLLGAIAAIGAFQGFKHLIAAGVLAVGASEEVLEHSAVILLTTSVLLAAAMAGAANRRTEACGLILGAGTAGVFLGCEFAVGRVPLDEWLIGLPVLLSLVGVLGGFAGRLIYPPAPMTPRFSSTPAPVVAEKALPFTSTDCIRILVGLAVALSGTIGSDVVRGWIARAAAGHTTSFGSSPFIAWQISTLAILLGGAVAGANTRTGLRHGLICGLLAGIGLAAAVAYPGMVKVKAAEFWIDQLAVPDSDPLLLAVVAVSVWATGTIGGWMGAHLVPPSRR